MRYLRTIGAAVALCLSSQAYAMTMTQEKPQGTTPVLLLQGSIVEGDYKQFLTISNSVAKAYPNTKPYVYLNSSGGKVYDASKIATVLRDHTVMVDSGKKCLSACFILFAAGKNRFIGKGANIGVHSTYNGVSRVEDVESQGATVDMSRRLTEYGVTPYIIGKLVTTGYSDMYYLSEADLLAMRVTILDGKTTTAPPPSASSSDEWRDGVSWGFLILFGIIAAVNRYKKWQNNNA